MASTAISAQGTKLYIAGTAGGAKTISGTVGVGNPTILTSTSHGFVNGDYITFSANFAGANAASLNSKSYVVQMKTTNTFAVAEDTTALTITVGTATATAAAWTQVKNLTSIKALDGSAKEIETTNHDSTAAEFLLGLNDNGNLAIEVDGDRSDAGQLALQAARDDRAIRTFKYTLPSGSTPTVTFSGFVKKFDDSAPINDKYKRTADIRITGAATFA